MTLFRVVLVAFALLASPAGAQSHVKTVDTPPPDGTCSAAELALIDAAFVEAHGAIRYSLKRLAADPRHPELRRWFGTTPTKLVMSNLERIAARAAQGRPEDTACNHSSHCQNRPAAYARPSDGALGFCETFFRAADRGQDSRFGIVVHEVSHISIRTRDVAYQPQRSIILAKQDPATAAMNADSYEYLIEAIYR
ncbi:M35 family metallo-endopeptidase [Roseococcus pinisoli]|uniref:Lysine-specific metallo-endopeptidase domain-containing protein n=1 Tax=Roseococcus pinisoli TaxID=2835040 RepID=A0ABS5Q891_9PROT|nr:M35 family metallo-endopeptidase [Roseococcus pinisoli]MBS7809709.1 hypothetical protein [Roseococcus pinisoli]